MIVASAALVACSDESPRAGRGGSLSGQVVVSGPLRGAKVSVDQIDFRAKSSLDIRAHVGDTESDENGDFSLEDVGTFNGVLLVTAEGGSFTELASGATIVLDPTVGIESIVPLDLLERRDDALVSPVGQLITARARWKMSELGDVAMALQDAEDHVSRHFGNAPWLRIKLASLDTPATSPTESVRAALVQAALSFLAHDIAQASGASPQEVNTLTLTQQLTADIGQRALDGNDGNSLVFGEGLQLGKCAPITDCSAPPGTSCVLGACRPLCDLYAGTPRSLLAGELTKVIQSPGVNRTGLVTGDILAVARAMADNVDEDLFGAACIETLDRLPPRIDFVAPTPAELDYKRGSFGVKAVATDDQDPMPRVEIVGYANDAAGSAAAATIDSTKMPDGMLDLTAVAHDVAGNAAMTRRVVRVDNTPPVLTLAPAPGLFVDGTTWWSPTSTPQLQGTVTDGAPVAVTATTLAGMVAATVSGSSWTGSIPGALDLAGADVAIAALDAAGNQTQVTQKIRADVTPPQLTFATSTVRNEATETPTFDDNEAPVHIHTGSQVDLASPNGCPAVMKFSYLLTAAPPPFGREVTSDELPDPNPIQYVLVGSDDGVGIAAGSTQYRVGFQTGNVTTWLIDWTPAAANPGGGSDQYKVGIFSDQIPQLATTEGIYRVEFRTTDRLARTTMAARCFDLRLRAPPLHFQVPGDAENPIPAIHKYWLESLTLGTGTEFSAIATRLLNDNATGASVLDEDVTNGTASTVYLEVRVTKPTRVHAGQRFVLRNFSTTQNVNIDCTDDPDNPPPALCLGPLYDSPLTDVTIDTLDFPVKVFELDAGLHPAAEIPCTVCGTDRWQFAIPPRTVGAPPRRFKVMTMVERVSALWPSDIMFDQDPPFADTTLNGRPFTGRTSPVRQGCTLHNRRTLPDGTVLDTCTRLATITAFRALKEIRLNTPDFMQSTYATSPTLASTPTVAASNSRTQFSLAILQGLLPSDP